VVEIKAFVPSRDFELSKKFYSDIGFELKWSSDHLAYFAYQATSFLLQNFYLKEHSENFMMHMLVNSADEWWSRIKENNIAYKYSVAIGDPEDRNWGIRDFTLIDPSGVLWRIGNNI
jgi:hypothetical protein